MGLPVGEGRCRENNGEFRTGIGIYVCQKFFFQGGRKLRIPVQTAVPQEQRIQHQEDMGDFVIGGKSCLQVVGQIGKGGNAMGTAYGIIAHIGWIDILGKCFRCTHGEEDPLVSFLLQTGKISGAFCGFLYFQVENSCA